MWILLVALIVTNVVTVGVLAWFLLRPAEQPRPDDDVARAISHRRPTTSTSSVRRVITIEILNPIELAGTRGWWAGIAGSLAPGLTNRVVYDQAIKLVRSQLANHNVVADVRLQVLDPGKAAGAPTRPATSMPGGTAAERAAGNAAGTAQATPPGDGQAPLAR